VKRVFLSHSFAMADRALVTYVESLLRSHGVIAINGKIAGIQPFELADTRFVVGLAQQIAARVKDHVIPEES
jgi:hypothetical protein